MNTALCMFILIISGTYSKTIQEEEKLEPLNMASLPTPTEMKTDEIEMDKAGNSEKLMVSPMDKAFGEAVQMPVPQNRKFMLRPHVELLSHRRPINKVKDYRDTN